MARASRFLTLAMFACGGVLAVGLAWAYWTGSGTGTASGDVTSITAPGSVTAAATPGSPTVPVSWAATTGPGGGAIDGYYVSRMLGSTPSPACGTSSASLLGPGTTSCNDTSVPSGTYTYTVTAVFHSWTAVSAASAAVTVNALANFAVSAPGSATAGTSFSVTVTARNASNATIAGYVGTVHFTSSDPSSPVLPADYTFVTGDNGTHTFTNGVTLTTGPSQTITVNDTTDSTKTGTATVTVTAGTAAQLAVTQQPNGGTGATVWTAQPIVAVQDAFGNTVTTSNASVTLAITREHRELQARS